VPRARRHTHTHTSATCMPHTHGQALLELMSTQSALASGGVVDALLEAALQQVERIVSALSCNSLRIFCPCAAEGVIAKLVSLGFAPIRRLPPPPPASARATAAGAQASDESGGCECAEVLPLPTPALSHLPLPTTGVAAAGMGMCCTCVLPCAHSVFVVSDRGPYQASV